MDIWVVPLYLCWLLDGKALIILESSSALVHDNSVGAWSSEELVPWWYVIDPSPLGLFTQVEPLVVVLVYRNTAAEHDVWQVLFIAVLPGLEVDDIVEIRWRSCSSAAPSPTSGRWSTAASAHQHPSSQLPRSQHGPQTGGKLGSMAHGLTVP